MKAKGDLRGVERRGAAHSEAQRKGDGSVPGKEVLVFRDGIDR